MMTTTAPRGGAPSMSRDAGMTPSWTCTDPRLVRCGPWATILYHQGRSKCDGYGRLAADPDRLLAEVMPAWGLQQQITAEQIQAARDALARERLWHVYTVAGQTYAEYEGYDDDQQPSWLSRRAARPRYPDPPDRPDLAVAHRPHYEGKGRREEPAQTAGAVRESGPAAGVPSPAQEQSAVSAAGSVAPQPQESTEQQSAEPPALVLPDGFAELSRVHEQHSGRPMSSDDTQKLLAVLKDAQEAGIEWQSLRTVMLDAQRDFKKTRTDPVIKSIGYYLQGWNALIRSARDELSRQRGRPLATGPGWQVADEDPRERIRRERAQAEAGYAAG